MDRVVRNGVLAMAATLVAANYFVQFPIGAWLTWAAVIYPLTFLVTDCVNRAAGTAAAARVAVAGFVLGVPISFAVNFLTSDHGNWVTSVRIALASGAAFAVTQAVDIHIFSRLRRMRWWVPPLLSSAPAAALDTVLFFSLAFAGTKVPWVTLATGDMGVKLLMAFLMLLPYRVFISFARGAA